MLRKLTLKFLLYQLIALLLIKYCMYFHNIDETEKFQKILVYSQKSPLSYRIFKNNSMIVITFISYLQKEKNRKFLTNVFGSNNCLLIVSHDVSDRFLFTSCYFYFCPVLLQIPKQDTNQNDVKFIVNFEHISHLFLVSLLLTLNK